MRAELSRILSPDRVLARPIDRIAYASDASFYRLVPQVVVQPESVEEIRALFRFSHERGVPMTFRAAGTSLSGQAITDGILVDISKHWRRIDVEDGGRRVRVQPGAIGAAVNRRLLPHGAKIGPDPASINACMVGGILANNSSGMCCGVEFNSYHTVESLTFVLPSGVTIDSADAGAEEELARGAPEIVEGLLALRRAIRSSRELPQRIRAKYRIKNTTGYSLNAFLDYDEPVDILARLMIGSEGTLGFIAEAVFRTLPDEPVKSTGLLFFADVRAACAAIAPLRDSRAATLELMDRASMRSIENERGVPGVVRTLPPGAASLLVEYQCSDEGSLRPLEDAARRVFGGLELLEPPLFTREPAEQAALWKVRKGLFTSVGATRPQGTSVIMEDVAFPVESLASAVVDLRALFDKHGYDEAIIFGHAKDGNLHFSMSESFRDRASVARYETFMADLADLVVGRYRGSLKAEHGTGRNMAPFVEAEWGTEAYRIMKGLKALVDPRGLLNPGVILNENPRAHVTDLKSLPIIEEEVDRCIECGWCERMCPSRELTLTPRQRIVVQREIARLEEAGRNDEARALLIDFDYDVVQTCAADGMCATGCPVQIDTGQLVRRLRGRERSAAGTWLAGLAARNVGLVLSGARTGLRIGHVLERALGVDAVNELTRAASLALGTSMPRWSSGMPRVARPLRSRSAVRAGAVYLPTCTTRVFGRGEGDPPSSSPMEALPAVAGRADVPVLVPPDAGAVCCGLPFSSKGYVDAYRETVHRTVDRMWRWSGEGRIPIVVDHSSCAHTLATCRDDLPPESRGRYDRLTILDGIDFAHDVLLPRLSPGRAAGPVVLHPVCSSVKMETVEKLEAVARACADSVTVPLDAGCCGFAGDRGLLVPELTAAATRRESEEVLAREFEGYYSSARTCELAMSRATGRPYRSFWHLLERATR